eukprot:1522219-Pyramimonas_sp.AAC.1
MLEAVTSDSVITRHSYIKAVEIGLERRKLNEIKRHNQDLEKTKNRVAAHDVGKLKSRSFLAAETKPAQSKMPVRDKTGPEVLPPSGHASSSHTHPSHATSFRMFKPDVNINHSFRKLILDKQRDSDERQLAKGHLNLPDFKAPWTN